jgi:AraC family transcriptional regulator, transcriptional activator of pobA
LNGRQHRSMAYPRTIPNYDLYGDQARPAWSNAFNFEWIPQRSAPYQWVIQPHRHEAFLQILHLTAGTVQLQIEDSRSEVQAPCLIVIPAGHVHGFRFSKNIDGPVVTASQKALESVAAAVMPELLTTLRKPWVLPLQDDMRYSGQLMPLFLALEQESRTHAPGQMAAGTSLLVALMVQVHRISGVTDENPHTTLHTVSRKARQIEKFRALVDRRFRHQHSVQAYAAELGVTAGQLSRLCREVLGMSSLDAINARIVHEAQRELVYTSLPVKQLASELGFEDDAYFSRFFRKHTGLSPKAFRAQALGRMQGHAMSVPGL